MPRTPFNIIIVLCVFWCCVTSAFAGPATYQYDSLGRLTRSIGSSGAVTTYEYDAAGNRTRRTTTMGTLEAPVAAFIAAITTGTAPLAVAFTDTSTGMVESWLWDFGDSATSTEQHPVHTFARPGVYTVTLTAANRNQQASAVIQDFITVAAAGGPQPTITLAHGFQPNSTGVIDFTATDRTVAFRITLNNAGALDAVVDVGLDLAGGALVMVTPPDNCTYLPAVLTFTNITVPAGGLFTIDYTARYSGQETTNNALIAAAARVKTIRGWYDEASGLNRGGYTNLTATATATVKSQPMLTGTITDMSTSKAVFNAMVEAPGFTNTATDQFGRYRLDLSPGVYTLNISRYGFQTITLTGIAVRANQAKILDVSMTTPGVLQMVTTSLPACITGQEQNLRLVVSGGTFPYTFSLVSGQLPPGLFLNAATGNLTGAPTTAGQYPFTIAVSDKNSGRVERAFSLTITTALTVLTSPDLTRATVGENYARTLTATGGTPPYGWQLTAGSLPQGLTLATGGQISGAPTTTTEAYFTALVSDASGTAQRDFHLGTDQPLRLTTELLHSAITGRPFAQVLTATGGLGPYTWAVTTGNLPEGLQLQSGNGILVGVPSKKDSGTVTLAIKDSQGRQDSREFPWTAGDPLRFNRTVPSEGYKDLPYTFFLPVEGGNGPRLFTNLGPLPPGLSFDEKNGVISGRPLLPGFTNLAFKVTDSAFPNRQEATQVFSLRIHKEPPSLPGDLNGDGVIDLGDVDSGLKILTGNEAEPATLRNTSTGKVQVQDLLQILRRLKE